MNLQSTAKLIAGISFLMFPIVAQARVGRVLLEAEQAREAGVPTLLAAVAKGGVRCRQRRHAVLHHQDELPRVVVQHLAISYAFSGRLGVVREILKDRERRQCENLLVTHDLHSGLAELKRVIYRNHAGLRCIKRARSPGGMYGHMLPDARRFANSHLHLFGGELKRRRGSATRQRALTCFVNLDEIGALLYLRTNRGHQLSRIVRLGGVGEHALLGILADGILMSAQNVDGVATDTQPGPWKQPLVDRVAHPPNRRLPCPCRAPQ
jgi:hypothetical protein